MLERIVRWSIQHRVHVAVVTLLFLALGVFATVKLPIDALPDVTNVQVVVLTDSPGLTAEEVERFVTAPVEMGLNGLPKLEELRSVTRAGLSAVTIVFNDDTDVWFARQLVSERLREIEANIPDEFGSPQLAPVSTGLGEIFIFKLRSATQSSMELRDLLQWELGPALRSVPGVIEVNAMGGAAKEYQVVLDPSQLAAHHLGLREVLTALERNNANVGGGWIERGPEQFVIRGEGQLRTTEEIDEVVVATDTDGTPIQIKRLGAAQIGASLPYGVVTTDGEGEAVTGTVLMLLGQNSRDVVERVHARIAELRRTLPEGVTIETVYDRKSFIDRTVKTVAVNLLEGVLLVALVIFIFLGSLRASLLVTLGIPFAMFVAIFGMHLAGVDGSLMSLGAIDFGLLVDGPIVMVEAVIAAFAVEAGTRRKPIYALEEALLRVARPVVFSVTIILLVYVPLLTLEGVEGKMFRPMATTMSLALFGSVIFALVVFPAGAALFLKPSGDGHHGPLARLEAPYERAVAWAIRKRATLLGAAIGLLVACLPLAAKLGADFVPRIDEGDMIVSIKRIPSIGLSEARRLDLEVERVLKRFPEVVTTLALTGRAEVATDPMGIDSGDMYVALRPKEQWRTAHDLDSLGAIVKDAIEREVPSTFISISQPIEDRTNELISGSRADVSILLFGDDLHTLSELGGRIGTLLHGVPGAGDVRVERALGLPMLTVRPGRTRLSRYGLAADDVLSAVEASRQGKQVGFVFEGQRRYQLRLMLPPTDLSAEAFARLPIGLANGEVLPLGQVADVDEVEGPAMISRQDLRRRLRVDVNIRGRDLVSFVNDAKARVEAEIPLPHGYSMAWGGQFENFERASKRLGIVVPIALLIIFAMLLGTFSDVRYAAAVFSGVPFALIGGIVALAARGMPFSIPAAVGFIALCGIAVLNGVVMASEIKRRIEEGSSIDDALRTGATSVLRAVLLTATVAAIGFAPMALSKSAGSEVQQPLATAVIGGVVSSTLLGLFLLPGLLRMFLKEPAHPPEVLASLPPPRSSVPPAHEA